MSKFASKFQKVLMSFSYRGKEIFKPLNTGRIDERVSAVREWVANVFFYTKNGKTIMIDAGYNYERLAEKFSISKTSKWRLYWCRDIPSGIWYTLLMMPMMNGRIPRKRQGQSGF